MLKCKKERCIKGFDYELKKYGKGSNFEENICGCCQEVKNGKKMLGL